MYMYALYMYMYMYSTSIHLHVHVHVNYMWITCTVYNNYIYSSSKGSNTHPPRWGSSWAGCARCPGRQASLAPSLRPAAAGTRACRRGNDRRWVVAVPFQSYCSEGSICLCRNQGVVMYKTHLKIKHVSSRQNFKGGVSACKMKISAHVQ